MGGTTCLGGEAGRGDARSAMADASRGEESGIFGRPWVSGRFWRAFGHRAWTRSGAQGLRFEVVPGVGYDSGYTLAPGRLRVMINEWCEEKSYFHLPRAREQVGSAAALRAREVERASSSRTGGSLDAPPQGLGPAKSLRFPSHLASETASPAPHPRGRSRHRRDSSRDHRRNPLN